MQQFKTIIRSVARASGDTLLKSELLPDSKDCILTYCSRAYFSCDVSFASSLIGRYKTARDHIMVREGQVKLIHAERFSSALAAARHDKLSLQIQSCEAQVTQLPPRSTKSQKVRSKISFLAGVAKQWVPISKLLSISAILDNNNEIVANTSNSIMDHLAQQWAPI